MPAVTPHGPTKSNEREGTEHMDTTHARRALLLCACAATFLGIYGWVQNSVLFPRFAEFFPVAREIDTAIRVLLYAAVALVVNRKPALLDPRTIAAVGIVAIASSTALLYVSVIMESSVLAVGGVALFELGHIWAVVFFGLALCLLPTVRHTAIAAAGGTALSDIIELIIGALPLVPGMATLALLPLGTLALTWGPASHFLADIQKQPAPSDVEISHPRAFLKPTHLMFACILVFSMASGYGLTFNEIGNAPIQSHLTWMLMLALTIAFIAHRKPGGEDALFSLSVLFIVAGFLAAPFTFDTESGIANALLRMGRNCVELLLWMTIAAIGKRNPLAMLTALCIANAAEALGTLVGAVAGHSMNDLVAAADPIAPVITAVALFALIAFLWLKLRTFSFEATIAGIEMPEVPAEAPVREDTFDERCKAIGAEHGLTERETELFTMMAHGRNASFIEEHFVISRNTVKTHVKRIYKKLDVHSQQELIDLAEGAQAAEETAPATR